MAVVVKKYSADRLDECVAVLANAFVTNPLHLAAFGDGRIDKNRLFFRIGLRHMFHRLGLRCGSRRRGGRLRPLQCFA